jgi:hypothetical protein
MGNVKFIINRSNFREQILDNRTLLDDVQEQMEGMGEAHKVITVYRNHDRTHGNVVATAPAAVEARHGVLTQMLGMVRV